MESDGLYGSADWHDMTEKYMNKMKQRPLVWKPEIGGWASEYSMTVKDDLLNHGMTTNIPTIYDGEIVDDETALMNAINANGHDSETGRKLDGYPSETLAIMDAMMRSASLNSPEEPAHEKNQGMQDYPRPDEDLNRLLKSIREAQ